MGDRANVLVKDDDNDNGIYLYTHWAGTELPYTLQEALGKKWRWRDTAYLTRIIFDTMTKDQQGNETGYGISTFCGDGDNRIFVVNCGKQTVTRNNKSWTFTEYINLSNKELSQVWYQNNNDE